MIKEYFERLRFDPNHHIGLGDIRLTIAQQEEIIQMFEDHKNDSYIGYQKKVEELITVFDAPQIKLLLFLESCCVTADSKISFSQLDPEKVKILFHWREKGFIKLVPLDVVQLGGILSLEGPPATHHLELSPDAWAVAHQLRRRLGAKGI